MTGKQSTEQSVVYYSCSTFVELVPFGGKTAMIDFGHQKAQGPQKKLTVFRKDSYGVGLTVGTIEDNRSTLETIEDNRFTVKAKKNPT